MPVIEYILLVLCKSSKASLKTDRANTYEKQTHFEAVTVQAMSREKVHKTPIHGVIHLSIGGEKAPLDSLYL
jgi:hypothetical protein